MAEKQTEAHHDLQKDSAGDEKPFYKRLGDLAASITSRFTFGGHLSPAVSEVRLVFKKRDGEWSEIVFPGASEDEMKELASACSVASFGLDEKQVTDKSYRDAMKLDPDCFATTFQLSSTSVLGEVAMTMVPDVSNLRAELYKLNIYGPGGHFKAHVDTPRPNHMFGSLVVCLPTTFSGGALVTRHENHQVRFDWSSSPGSPKEDISWAAFFSDVEHEVLPVTDGYRVTLTYNLHGVPGDENSEIDGVSQKAEVSDASSITCVVQTPFYNLLLNALGCPTFLRGGGILGFGTHHKYPQTILKSSDPMLFKGSDQMVVKVAKALGLFVTVLPVLGRGKVKNTLSRHRYLTETFVEEFQERDGDCCEECESDVTVLSEMFHITAFKDKYITWCQDLTVWQPAGASIHMDYKMGERLRDYYQTAAILIVVPEWNSFRRSCSDLKTKLSTCGDAAKLSMLQQQVVENHKDGEEIMKKLCYHNSAEKGENEEEKEEDDESESSDDFDPWSPPTDDSEEMFDSDESLDDEFDRANIDIPHFLWFMGLNRVFHAPF